MPTHLPSDARDRSEVLAQFAGTWIAIWGDEIVAAGPTPDEVFVRIDHLCLPDASVTRVPEPSLGIHVGMGQTDVHWFAYQPGPEKSRKAFPDEPVMRPVLDVVLRGPGSHINTPLLVDSGSEYTLVTKAFARRLGVEASLDSHYTEAVKMGGQTLEAYLGIVTIEVPTLGHTYESVIGFVDNWTFAHSGLLGQRGFFDRFGVLSDRANLRFGLIRHDDMEELYPSPPVQTPVQTESPPPRFSP